MTTPVTAPPPALPSPPPPKMPTVPSKAQDVQDVIGAGDGGKPWYRRPRWWLYAVACVLLVIAGAVWWLQSRAVPKPAFVTQPVALGDLTLNVTANGTLQPTRAISIGSELSGTVLKVNVDVNDRVQKGQVLLELDTAKLHDQILRSSASLSSANAKVLQAQSSVAEGSASLTRLEDVARLSGGKVPSKTELDASRALHVRAVAELTSAQAGVSDARAALSTDQTNLSKASIRAPSNGVVLTRTVDPGNAVAASLQAVTLFTVAEDLAQLRLQVYVDEADVGNVKNTQTASFTVSAYPRRKYPATVTRVAFGSTITDNVVTYLTYLAVDNTDLSLRPGMTATATIVAVQRKQVLLVPNAALRYSPTDAALAPAATGIFSGMGSSNGSAPRKSAAASASTASARQVWVLQEGSPKVVAVTPGISDGRMTEVTGGALEAGMQVITGQKSAALP